jgi:hypothetical protein
MMVQGALLRNTIKAKAPLTLMQMPKKAFSSTRPTPFRSYLAYGMAGAAITGITWLNYKAA